jgi:hypothetical protein
MQKSLAATVRINAKYERLPLVRQIVHQNVQEAPTRDEFLVMDSPEV